jgi:hypothetical protein
MLFSVIHDGYGMHFHLDARNLQSLSPYFCHVFLTRTPLPEPHGILAAASALFRGVHTAILPPCSPIYRAPWAPGTILVCPP